MSSYTMCSQCGYDSCICPEPIPAQQRRPLKVKLTVPHNKSPASRPGPSAISPKKRGRLPKAGRFSLAAAHAHAAYDPRARAHQKTKKSNSNKPKNNVARRSFPFSKGARGGYRPDDDDYYYEESDAFPTFISAVSSTEDEGFDEEAISATPGPVHTKQEVADGHESDESSELTDPDDISIQASEERFIIAEERARVKRELMGQDDTTGSHKKRFDWQTIPSKNSPSSVTGLDQSDSDSSSDEHLEELDEEDETAEDEPEADAVAKRDASIGLAERYYSSEDDFDAAVFFASLDESDNDDAAAEADDDATSTASEFDAPLTQQVDDHLLSQDMYGLLVFGDPLAGLEGLRYDIPAGLEDLRYDIPTVPTTAVQSPTHDQGDTTESDDDDDAMDIDTDQDGTEDEFEDQVARDAETDDGETTDDMGEDELAQILTPRLPTPPPQGVDPLALLTPVTPMDSIAALHTPVTQKSGHRRRSSSESSISQSSYGSVPAPVFPRKTPSMGRFQRPEAASALGAETNANMAVIDGKSSNIPSPFTRRLREGLSHTRRKRYTKSRRHDSPASLAGESSDHSSYSMPGPSFTSFMDLHDVLDTAILEDEEDDLYLDSQVFSQDPTASESDVGGDHSRSLTRWDRVPMNTFRRTRGEFTMSLEVPVEMTMSLPVGVGLGYAGDYGYGDGSPGGQSGWWEAESGAGGSSGSKRDRRRNASATMQAVLALSPILFPTQGGDDTGSPHEPKRYGTPSQGGSPHKIHRTKERRAKKSKTVDSAAVKPQKRLSHVQRTSSLQNVPPLRL